jgi:hypothetical protein
MREYYPAFALRLLRRRARRDFFRAAVFLCMVLVEATLSSLLAMSLNCSLALAKSPLLSADSKRFICVLTWCFRARFIALFLAFCLTLFFADNECATIIS